MHMPINFKNWIDENRHLLKPPVGNQVVYKDKEFIIMVVGGPNVRKDYHINEGEEFFYQLEGDIVLSIRQGGKPKDIEINEEKKFLDKYGSKDSGASLGDILSDALKENKSS